jgi:hypothetical protein
MEYSVSGSSIVRVASWGVANEQLMAQLKTNDLG